MEGQKHVKDVYIQLTAIEICLFSIGSDEVCKFVVLKERAGLSVVLLTRAHEVSFDEGICFD